jgi:hypothetical protein
MTVPVDARTTRTIELPSCPRRRRKKKLEFLSGVA